MAILRSPDRHLVGIDPVGAEEIVRILDRARALRDQDTAGRLEPTLTGTPIVTLFYEASTRTRTSFEIAALKLGAQVVSIASASSSVAKGESLWDTGRTLAAMGPGVIVCRHGSAGAPLVLARAVESVGATTAVVNAGDGAHEHPTQALLDLLTIRDALGEIEGLRVAIIGDIAHSRVARSNIWGLRKMGAEVAICGPPTMIPVDVEDMGVEVHYRVEDAIRDADVVYALRIQLERQKGVGLFPSLREYSRLFGINADRLNHAKPGAIVMHPGPINRGVELDSAVADGSRSVILNQVTNGVAVRMAVLYLLNGGGERDDG